MLHLSQHLSARAARWWRRQVPLSQVQHPGVLGWVFVVIMGFYNQLSAGTIYA